MLDSLNPRQTKRSLKPPALKCSLRSQFGSRNRSRLRPAKTVKSESNCRQIMANNGPITEQKVAKLHVSKRQRAAWRASPKPLPKQRESLKYDGPLFATGGTPSTMQMTRKRSSNISSGATQQGLVTFYSRFQRKPMTFPDMSTRSNSPDPRGNTQHLIVNGGCRHESPEITHRWGHKKWLDSADLTFPN